MQCSSLLRSSAFALYKVMVTLIARPRGASCDSGTNKQEDVDIYAFDPPTPADAGTLSNVAVNSTDEVLKGLLREDIHSVPRRIAGWENHRENLPEDPSQVTGTWCLCVCISVFTLSRHDDISDHHLY